MPQTWDQTEADAQFRRLLPGDRAPDLRLSIPLNGDRLPAVRFDRLSLVVLWNAGCGTCMPALERISELGAAHNVRCYGVGVMVHNLEGTKERMAGRAPKAILAIEERPSDPPGLSRGWVTRQWLEPSGQEGVPAAFVVDDKGTIIWMGHPDGLDAVFPKMLNGGWVVETARRKWQRDVPDEDVAHLLAVRNLTDAFLAGQAKAAIALIDDAERNWPDIVSEKAYCHTKLSVLADDPDQRDAAVAHYLRCVDAFADDMSLQLGLAACVLEKTLPETALCMLVKRLKGHEQTHDCIDIDNQRGAMMQQWLNILLADALIRLGRHDEARPRIVRAEALLRSPALPERIKAEAELQIEKIKNSLDSGRL